MEFMPPCRRNVLRGFAPLTTWVLAVLLGLSLPGCGRSSGPLPDGLYLRTHLSSSSFLWIEMVYVSGDRIAWHANGGVDPFDFDAAEKNDPKNVGRFKIKGDQIEIAWGGGKGTTNWHLEYKDGKVSAIDAGGIVPATPYAKGTRLEASFDGNIGPPHELTKAPVLATLSFTKDGKCNLFASGTKMYGNTVLEKKADIVRPGTYELSGNTLTIHFTDGATERHTVLPFNKALDPGHAKLTDEQLFYDGVRLDRAR